ncbi:hypothetical protein P6B95_37095 [Streptomyces atratus]|uniref:hypothetical protein n=1 Tax=Streptomyces atratus TaxID=1893 RepID=UPI001670FFF0|nr:hypothetical protein [Streptomyces atratus]WPW32445.1 hypothetical protein P6B95_37095 [Streptomyces atratus]GGT38602.1 hypothetical protein GCM10010207_43480 [Streptomyces atratus]
MKKSLAWAVTLVTAATCTLGTVLPATAADNMTATAAASASNGSAIDTSKLDPQTKALVDEILAKLPADWQARLQAANAKYGIGDAQWTEIRNSVINPGDYQCQSTELTAYANNLLDGAEDPFTIFILSLFGGFDLPTYDALLFGSESKSNTYGVNGEYTNQLKSEAKDLKKFWDIYSDDIQLMPMHGADVFSSPERLARTLSVLYGGTTESNLGLADLFISLVGSEPVLKGGANPIFTFNAFAYSEKGDPQPLGISDRIVMGDGILEATKAIGLGDTAPRAILAHEFGHHVQYEDNLFDNTTLTGPEATRRTELMADAFGTYFLTHSRGEALNTKRVLGSAQSFYQVGDCSFTSNGHHGTPNQRLAASTWGASVANEASDQGHILPSMKLDEMFEVKLPDIVKPDATN